MIRNVPVSKLKIYKHSSITGKKDELVKYVAQINPTSYSIDYRPDYFTEQEAGSDGARLKFNAQHPAKLNFEIIFDSTGSLGIGTLSLRGVQPEIDHFLEVAYDVSYTEKTPNLLQIQWGALVYVCKLTSLSVAYNMFDFSGNPCRATASACFKHVVTKSKQLKNKRTKSTGAAAAVTKLIAIGDKLDALAAAVLVAATVVTTAKKVIDIAKENKLTTIRGPEAAEPGSEITISDQSTT
jgi:hypothetical protein